MVTNTVRRGPSSVDQRHQFDYYSTWLELREVESTAASKDSCFLREVDATDGSKKSAKLSAVFLTSGSSAE